MNHIGVKVRLLVLALAAIAITYKLGYANGWQFVHSLVAFIIIISIIVFVHEFGHYIVAKWAGVKIDTFSLGFGNELWGFNDKSGTRWKVSSLPLGGYVKMFGDATEASMPVEDIVEFTPEEKSKAFYFKPLYKKAAIVVAGPLFNFIFAIVIFTFFGLSGGMLSSEPVVGEVRKDTPAEAAGLKPGDRIVSINGEKALLFSDISRMILTNIDTPVKLVYLRDGSENTVTLTPKQVTEKDDLGNSYTRPIIGIISKDVKVQSLNLPGAISAAVRETYYRCAITLEVVGQIIAGKRSAQDTLQGPIGMAKITGQAADKGIRTTFWIMAIISVNLGLINLFPIPVLDGGHLLFYGIEAVQGKPPGKHFQEYGMRIGMALVVMLMAYSIINDIHHWLLTFVGK